jgi:hypothetical protein
MEHTKVIAASQKYKEYFEDWSNKWWISYYDTYLSKKVNIFKNKYYFEKFQKIFFYLINFLYYLASSQTPQSTRFSCLESQIVNFFYLRKCEFAKNHDKFSGKSHCKMENVASS